MKQPTLGLITNAFTREPELLQEFGRAYGVDSKALLKWTAQVRPERNTGVHQCGMSFAEISRLRGEWLGLSTGDGGAFRALVPRTA